VCHGVFQRHVVSRFLPVRGSEDIYCERFSNDFDIPMPSSSAIQPFQARASGLVDVLDRVLDKGLVIAGDVKVSIAEVELLTIRIRLLVCSIDKAQEVGLDWWKHDRHLSVGSQQPLALENAALRERIAVLEQQVAAVEAPRASRRVRARARSR
jgi:hypothetical protein